MGMGTAGYIFLDDPSPEWLREGDPLWLSSLQPGLVYPGFKSKKSWAWRLEFLLHSTLMTLYFDGPGFKSAYKRARTLFISCCLFCFELYRNIATLAKEAFSYSTIIIIRVSNSPYPRTNGIIVTKFHD